MDDLLLLGHSNVIDAVILGVQKKWETSEPERIGMNKEVRFLGAELWKRDDGAWLMTQTNYIKDLLKRNLGNDPTTWPTRKVPLLKEPEINGSEEKDSRKCQGGTEGHRGVDCYGSRQGPGRTYSIHCIETGIIDHEVTIAGGTAGQVSVVLPSWYNGSRFDLSRMPRVKSSSMCSRMRPTAMSPLDAI